MPRKNKQEPIPEDLLAMSEAELQEMYDFELSTEGQAEFDSLVTVRDAAQQDLTDYVHRKFQITRALVEKKAARLALREKESA